MAKEFPFEQEGKRLEVFLEKQEITVKKLATETNMSLAKIYRYLTGETPAPHELLVHLYTKHKMRYEWYFNGEGRMKLRENERISNDAIDVRDLKHRYEILTERYEGLQRMVVKLANDLQELKSDSLVK